MGERDILIVAGLACDLVGAFLLSIPLVWNAKAAGELMVRMVLWLEGNLKSFLMDNLNPFRHPILCITQMILWFTITGLIFNFYLGPGWSFDDVRWWEHWAVAGISVVATTLLNIAAYFGVKLLGAFFLYVSSGDRDKKVGFGGLVILCLGFALQAWVNFIT